MSKMIDYLNNKYSQVTFTGEEVVTIPNFQDAYAAIVNETCEKVWLVSDEDNAVFMSDADLIEYKAEMTKIFFAALLSLIYNPFSVELNKLVNPVFE